MSLGCDTCEREELIQRALKTTLEEIDLPALRASVEYEIQSTTFGVTPLTLLALIFAVDRYKGLVAAAEERIVELERRNFNAVAPSMRKALEASINMRVNFDALSTALNEGVDAVEAVS